MIDRERLLREEDDAWQMLVRCFDAVPESRFEEPTFTMVSSTTMVFE